MSKETEKLLQMANNDLRDLDLYIQELSAFLPLAICAVNPFGLLITINSAFQDLTGYKEAEAIGKRMEKMFANGKEFRDLISSESVLKKKKQKRKMILLVKSGREIPVSMSISARRDENGEFIGYFIALLDIEDFEKLRESLEKKVKERTGDLERKTEELRESRVALMNVLEDVENARMLAEEEKNKTMAIITNFSDGLLFFDFENKLSLINSQAKSFFNIKSSKLIGKRLSEFSKKSELDSLVDVIKNSKNSRIKEVYREELNLKKNVFFEVSTVFLKRDKKKIGSLIIIHDVSREKVVERLKTEFVSLSAHQLRTPLSAIKWTLRMLLDGDLGKVNPDQKEYIEKTYKSNERMIALVNDLLNVTRIEEGRYLYRKTTTEVQPLIEFVISSLRDKTKKQKIKLEFIKPKKKVPKIKVDVEKVRMAIYNIINNAISYTPHGGKVDVSLMGEKDGVRVEVSDNGIGIPKDQQKRVFSKFFRAGNAVREETTGTGLGLYITKNIIEAHNGKVWFDSKEGKGTTFYFTIPFTKNH